MDASYARTRISIDGVFMDEALRPETANKQSGFATFTTFVCALLAASVFLNVLLARKISSLRIENGQLHESTRLQVGASVPALTGHAVDGTPMNLNFDDVSIPTVIYVFSPQCGWCAKNFDNFRSLIAQAGNSYRLVGLAMTRQDLGTYLSREHLTLPVFADVDSAIVSAYELSATPTTIVVSPQRKVLRVWTGAYQDGVVQEIEAYLGVRLLPCCEKESPGSKPRH